MDFANDGVRSLAKETVNKADYVMTDVGNTMSAVRETIHNANGFISSLDGIPERLVTTVEKVGKDIHKIGQDFGHMAKSLACISQDFHQMRRCIKVTCFSLTMSALASSMIYLQNSSCSDNQESMLCVAPLNGMAATMIGAGFVALSMLIMPNRVQHQINDDFLIPEEGIDQNVEWTQEELDSIKAKNFNVFSLIEIKRQFGDKWHKQELQWLLSQDKNIFLKVLSSGVYTTSGCLGKND